MINCLPEECVINIISSAVNIEMEFIVDTLPVELIGMNSTMMCNYIKFCADRLLIASSYQRHHKIGNPFEWLDMISLPGKTIFFGKLVGEFSKFRVGMDRADLTFALKASF